MKHQTLPEVLITVNPSIHKYAIIVPCYNEEIRFPYNDFLDFAKKKQ